MEHEKYMREALREASYAAAEDEVPIGAVIICRGRIVGKGHNMTEKLNDPTAHAEMIAITAATEALGGKYLNDCTLYVTVEPCPMCAGAIMNARIKKLYIGAMEPKFGSVGSKVNLLEDVVFNHNVEVEKGVCEEESVKLLQSFFKELRTRNKERKK